MKWRQFQIFVFCLPFNWLFFEYATIRNRSLWLWTTFLTLVKIRVIFRHLKGETYFNFFCLNSNSSGTLLFILRNFWLFDLSSKYIQLIMMIIPMVIFLIHNEYNLNSKKDCIGKVKFFRESHKNLQNLPHG